MVLFFCSSHFISILYYFFFLGYQLSRFMWWCEKVYCVLVCTLYWSVFYNVWHLVCFVLYVYVRKEKKIYNQRRDNKNEELVSLSLFIGNFLWFYDILIGFFFNYSQFRKCILKSSKVHFKITRLRLCMWWMVIAFFC